MKPPLGTVAPAKMLVRALKMLGYFRNETARTDIATAALISRAMKVRLMTDDRHLGNDEPHGRLN
jgi:hypothetical protein